MERYLVGLLGAALFLSGAFCLGATTLTVGVHVEPTLHALATLTGLGMVAWAASSLLGGTQ